MSSVSAPLPPRKVWLWAVVWLAVVVAGVIGVRVLGTGAGLASCLTLAEGEIVESQRFTPVDEMRLPPEPPILDAAGTADLPPHRWIPTNTLDGLPLQFAVGGTSESRFFSDHPLDPSMTLSGFLAEGGISFVQYPAAPGATAQRLLESLGERAVAVDVGQYAGVLTWADPRVTGVRHHEIWWSDGQSAYKLLADRSPVAVTNIARGMVCGLGSA